MSDVRIIEWDDAPEATRRQVRALRVADDQTEFGGSFEGSIASREAEAPYGTQALVLHDRENVVGLVLLRRPPVSPDWAEADMVTLHGFKIDHRHQGRGLGRRAFAAIIDHARARWPDARRLALSVDAGNTAALTLYQSFGMDDTGPIFDGRIGKEHRLTLAL